MELEDINFIKVSISLSVGDDIVDNVGNNYKIVYIDYICEIVVLNETSNVSVLNFNDIAGHFKRVVR